MGFPSSNTLQPKGRILAKAQQEVQSFKGYAEHTAKVMETNKLSANAITQCSQNMVALIRDLDALINTDGMDEYAQSELGRLVVADAKEVREKCLKVISAVKSVFTHDEKTGYIPLQRLEESGDVSVLQITPEQMKPVREALLEVLAAVE